MSDPRRTAAKLSQGWEWKVSEVLGLPRSSFDKTLIGDDYDGLCTDDWISGSC